MSKQQLYRHYDCDDNLLYVGISLSAINRLLGHKQYSHWFQDIVKVTIEVYKDRKTALHEEMLAIKKEKPKWNIEWNAHRPMAKKVNRVICNDYEEIKKEDPVNYNLKYTVDDMFGLW